MIPLVGQTGIRTSAALVAALSVPHRARATAPPQIELAEAISVEPGATCLDHDDLVQQVRMWVGRDQIDDRVRIVVRGDAQKTDQVWFGIEHDGELAASRTFDRAPHRCGNLHAAVSLAVAIAIDATILQEIAPAPPAAAQAPAPDPPTPPAGTTAPPQREPTRVGGALEGSILGGMPGRIGGGGLLAIELGPAPFLDIRLAGLAAGTRESLAAGSVVLVLAAARFDLCPVRTFGAARLRLCVGVASGALHARGRGFEAPRSTSVPWLAVVGGFGVQVPADRRVALGISLDAYVPVVRPTVTVGEPGAAPLASRPMPPVAGSLGIGPVVRFR